MAQINLTQLLGTDNIALSRPVINQNFVTAQNAINTLELFLNTTPAGAALSVGNVTINLGANNVNDTLFLNQASGIFQGNLSVNQNLNVTGATNFSGNVSFENAVTLLGTGPSPSFNVGSIGNSVDIHFNSGMYIDTQFVTETATPAFTETNLGTGVFDLDITDRRIVYLDYSGFTGGYDADEIQLVGTPIQGQKVFFRISNSPVGGGTFIILNTGFSPEYTTDLTFTGTSENELKRLWVELIYKSAGWAVVNSHPSITGI